MSHKIKIASGARWLISTKVIAQLVSWTATIFVMRTLNPEHYGIAAMTATFIALISLGSEFGFGTAIIQAKQISTKECSSIFSTALLFSLACYCALFLTSPLIAKFYNEDAVAKTLQVSGLSLILIAATTVPEALLKRELNFQQISLIELATTIVASICTLALALLDFGYWALITGPITGLTFRAIAFHTTANKPIFPSRSLAPALSLIKFGGKIAIARLAGYFVTQSDILLAGKFLGKESLGLYAVAVDLALMPLNRIMSIVNQLALSSLSKTARDNPERKIPELFTGLTLTAYIVFPCLWGIASIAPALISQLLGNKWTEAVLPLQIICATLPIKVIANYISTATISFGRADLEVKDKLTALVIFPASFFAGVQVGIIGLAVAWAIALPLTTIINLNRFQRAFSINYKNTLNAITKPIATSLIIPATAIPINAGLATQKPWIAITTVVIAAGTAYIISLKLIDQKHFDILISGIIRQRNRQSDTTPIP